MAWRTGRSAGATAHPAAPARSSSPLQSRAPGRRASAGRPGPFASRRPGGALLFSLARPPPRRGGEETVAGRYGREWQAHVLANLPFYELLPPRFLALMRARVSSQGDAALADVLKVRCAAPRRAGRSAAARRRLARGERG